MGQADALSPEQVRNLCVSFAKLGYFNTQFKSVMADAIINKLDQFEPALLADTAWAFGEALYYDYELMTVLHGYLKQHADKFDASGLAKVGQGAGSVLCRSSSSRSSSGDWLSLLQRRLL